MAETSHYSPQALAFLRALKRNNDREWFKARRERYDALLRAPTIAIIERLAVDFKTFAPDAIADPKLSLYRIYRDTRFSENKAPLKTHVAAVFPTRGFPRHQGAGLYFEVANDGVWIGGGMWAPDTSQLQAVREHIAAHPRQLLALVGSPLFLKTVGPLHGNQLQRVPRGFPKDHPAGEYLKFRQYLVGKEFPGGFATNPRFYAGILRVFRQVAPLTTYLNDALRTSGRY